MTDSKETIKVFGVKGLKTIKKKNKAPFSLKAREDHIALFIHDLDAGSDAINVSLILPSSVAEKGALEALNGVL